MEIDVKGFYAIKKFMLASGHSANIAREIAKKDLIWDYPEAKKRVLNEMGVYSSDLEEFAANNPVFPLVFDCLTPRVMEAVLDNDLFSQDINLADNDLAKEATSDISSFAYFVRILMKRQDYKTLLDWVRYWKENFKGKLAIVDLKEWEIAYCLCYDLMENVQAFEICEPSEEVQKRKKLIHELIEITELLMNNKFKPSNLGSDIKTLCADGIEMFKIDIF